MRQDERLRAHLLIVGWDNDLFIPESVLQRSPRPGTGGYTDEHTRSPGAPSQGLGTNILLSLSHRLPGAAVSGCLSSGWVTMYG